MLSRRERLPKTKTEKKLHTRFGQIEICKLHILSQSPGATREKGEPWREIKLGRIFSSSDILPLGEKRNFVDKSVYVAHLGSAQEFFPRLEYQVEGLKNLAVISDGAKWIWNWVEDLYPNSIQILDFFHAKEHLCEFARDCISDPAKRKSWVDRQSKALLEKEPESVIRAIKLLRIEDALKEKRDKLLQYYTTNLERMRYRKFRQQNLLIGSGAIESAYKSVLQERLKLSGQHWYPDYNPTVPEKAKVNGYLDQTEKLLKWLNERL